MEIVFKIFAYLVFAAAVFFLAVKFFKDKDTGELSSAPQKLNKHIVFKIIAAVLASRIILYLLSWAFTYLIGYPREFLDVWNEWDAQHYLWIANHGYYCADEGWIRVVFYPLYPFAIWLLKFIFVNDIIASLAASWACLSGACVFLYKLMLIDSDHTTAARAVKFLLIFPCTVFLGAPYTESMFLLFSFGCMYFARVRRFTHASIMAGLAAMTRCTGVLLIALIFVEILYAHGLTPKYIRQSFKKKLRESLKDFASLLIVVACALSYLFLNHVMLQGNALAFMQYQSDHWSQGFGSYSNTLLTTYNQVIGPTEIRTKLMLWVNQFVVLIIGGLSLPLISKKMRPSYAAYSIVYVFVIFAPTWLLSGLRYYMGLAVLFPLLALATRRKWLDTALTILFAIFAVAFSCFFAVHWDIL